MPLTTRTVTGRVSLANSVDETITRIRFTPSKASYEEAQGAVVTPEHFYAIPDEAGDIAIPLFPTDISEVQTFYTVAAGSFADGRERFQSIGRMFLPSTGSTNIADLLEPADGVTVATINDMQVLLAQAESARDTVVSIASTFTSGLTFRGSLADVANLPITAELGDAYEINGDWWAWDGAEFDNIGPVRGEDGEQGPIGPIGPEGPTPVGALIDTNNLSDVADPATALSNIGGQPQSANLDAFSGKTAPAGAVVGTTDAQTLTNKTLTNAIINGPITGTSLQDAAAWEAGTSTNEGPVSPAKVAAAIAAQATGGIEGPFTQATATGSAFDWTGLPSGVKEIVLVLDGTTLSGAGDMLVQLGTSAGILSTGYDSTSYRGGAPDTSSAGMLIHLGSSGTRSCYITMSFHLSDGVNNRWNQSHCGTHGTDLETYGGGGVGLPGDVDRLRLTRIGTDTFTAGAAALLYR